MACSNMLYQTDTNISLLWISIPAVNMVAKSNSDYYANHSSEKQ